MVSELISIHALRGEGDGNILPRVEQSLTFQSTPSVGRATAATSDNADNNGISIHALRGEGDIVKIKGSKYATISIHALRGEGDRSQFI